MQFIDIIIFAVIAVLLVLRLRSVLGQRTGYEQPQDEIRANRFDQTDNDNEPVQLFPKASGDAGVAALGLDALRQIDRSFNEKQFIDGATAAFEMILTAYAEGDLAQLKRLLGYDLLKSFTASIQARTAAKESLVITLDDIREVSILNISVIDQVASITVHFHSVQTRIAKDENGEIIESDDAEARGFTDIWTFERDLTLSDPNWKLVETESETAED
ncbi:MAG: Tim44 domain-containing protein [Candidatus Puniceispirillum sp.]|nr:Tim44 domain-containing protein [Candidatus Puniceispirillum sp.]MBL6774730.1 Tim44 domain-containing protein [Candidatus Puniceispirillum sp.]